MEFNEFEELFHKELLKNNIENRGNEEKFFEYMKLLLEWNEKINLTAIKDEREFIIKHFIDSLTISKYFSGNENIIDVGTGAGFPGIPLKLFHKELFATLLDSVRKKVTVLENIVEKLSLKNVKCVQSRAEDFAKEKREKYDIAVSRAVANMSTLVEYLLPFVKIGGKIICMKGPNYEEELNCAKNAINILGGKVETVESFYINNELERNIIIIKKVKETPKKYPRGQSKPLREPIS